MVSTSTMKRWSALRGLSVIIPSQGRKAGVIEDFFFKAGTGNVDSFLVNTGLQGLRALPTSGISSVTDTAITIPHEEVLIRALPVLPSGNGLLSYKIAGETVGEVGQVGAVVLEITPPVMRIAALELAGKRGLRILGDEVLHYHQGVIVIDDQDARRLR